MAYGSITQRGDKYRVCFDYGVDRNGRRVRKYRTFDTKRDATVHILRGFGAQIAGEPFTFYRGRVTPILLKRTDFVRNTRK